MKAQGKGRGIRHAVQLMKRLHEIATGRAPSAEDAIFYFRDPKEFSRVIQSSGALDDPIRRKAMEKLIQKGAVHGV